MSIAVGANVYTSGTYIGTPITSASRTTSASGSSFLIACQGPASVTFTPTDSKSNVYTLIGTQQNDTVNNNAGAFYLCTNGTGGAGHTFSLAMSVHAGLSFYVVEITGGVTSTLLDQFFGNTGNLGNPVTGPVTTTAANELAISLLQCNGGSAPYTITPANGFATLLNDAQSALMTQIVGVAGTYDPDPGFAPTGGGVNILTASFFPLTGPAGTVVAWIV